MNEVIACATNCKHGAYRSADRTNRCLGCGLIAPSDCNCFPEANIWRIFGLSNCDYCHHAADLHRPDCISAGCPCFEYVAA